ncbi:flavodoxin short chain [Lachnospiraceae bacterium PF1-22]|uniref:flavodoxin n=1 Tax=Ohessyouella blattaphilus TaxID=2949333 RepID=UPI003E1E72EE
MAVSVVYWSMTGNTEAMAQAVAEGIKEAGKEVSVLTVDQANPTEIAGSEAFALGCPAMGDEVLEEGEFEPFMEALEGKIMGKKILLFGSYDWGDGEWMRQWVERVTGAGATVIGGEGIIANNAPDEASKAACRNGGKVLASV